MSPDDHLLRHRLDASQIVALTLYGEARGEPIEGRIAVGCVIRNRVRARYRGDSYQAVCLAPLQFSCWNTNDPNRPQLIRLATALADGQGAEIDDPVWHETLYVARGIVTDLILDRVGSARHYHAVGVMPDWSRHQLPVAQFYRHVFYEDIA